jgi:FixJ family two-component response regulator
MQIIKRSKDVLVADFSKSKVIFDLETYIPYILNHTAAGIWDFLRKPRKTAEIIAFLQKKYKISLAIAKKDTQKFIRESKEKGLLCLRKLN